MAREFLKSWFWLMVLLIAVVYFAGLSTDVKVLGDVFNSLSLTLTGRNKSGDFVKYPGNQPNV